MWDQNRITWGLEAEHGLDPGLWAPNVVMTFPLELTDEFPYRPWILRPCSPFQSLVAEVKVVRGHIEHMVVETIKSDPPILLWIDCSGLKVTLILNHIDAKPS